MYITALHGKYCSLISEQKLWGAGSSTAAEGRVLPLTLCVSCRKCLGWAFVRVLVLESLFPSAHVSQVRMSHWHPLPLFPANCIPSAFHLFCCVSWRSDNQSKTKREENSFPLRAASGAFENRVVVIRGNSCSSFWKGHGELRHTLYCKSFWVEFWHRRRARLCVQRRQQSLGQLNLVQMLLLPKHLYNDEEPALVS